jgi:hypothetical protein
MERNFAFRKESGNREDEEPYLDEMERDYDKIFGMDPLTGRQVKRAERREDIAAHAPEFVRVAVKEHPDLAYDYSLLSHTLVNNRYLLYKDSSGVFYWSRNSNSASVFEPDAIKGGSEQESPEMRRLRSQVEEALEVQSRRGAMREIS